MSWLKDIRDETAVVLTALALGPAVSVDWAPEVQRDKITQAQLIVFPAMRKTTSASRGCKLREATIGVFYVAPIEAAIRDTQAETAQLIGDAIEDLLNTKVLQHSITKIEQTEVLDHSEWRANNAITTTFLLTLELIGA